MTIADNLSAARRLAALLGGECMAMENFTIHDSVAWKCAEGHVWAAAFYSVRTGRQCASAMIREDRVKDNLTRARLLAKERGGQCLAENNFSLTDRVQWRCEEGHEWAAMLRNVLHGGTWCPRCRNKSEEYCHHVLAALFPDYTFERNVRNLSWLGTGLGNQPLELDVYSDHLRLALEFNGFLHEGPAPAYGGDAHYARIREHDARKTDACADEGVCLITHSSVSRNGRQIDPAVTAEAIWRAVADMRYPEGTHLATLEALHLSLGL